MAGAGVLLFHENYFNGHRREPTLLLFRDSKTKVYADAGGVIDPHCSTGRQGESPAEACAAAELREESQNLVNIQSFTKTMWQTIPSVQYSSAGFPPYTLYVLSMTTHNRLTVRDFASNRAKMLSSGQQVPHAWNETDDVKRFFLSDVRADVGTWNSSGRNRQRGHMRDVDGLPQPVMGRTLAGLRNIFAKYRNPTANPLAFKKCTQARSRTLAALQGTVTFIPDGRNCPS